MIKGDLYCKPCFLKVFKEKGSYASFGVKTLPNWKPGQDGDNAGGVGPATDGTASPPPVEAKAGTPAVDVHASTLAVPGKPAAPAAAADPGVNLSSSDLVNPKCKVCLKTVYDQEKQVYDKTVWHIACFKCLSCKRRIDVKSVAMIQGDLYCKPCFLKVFKEKGSYASFGPKTLPKWEGDKNSNGGVASSGASGGASHSPEPTTPVEAPASPDASASASAIPPVESIPASEPAAVPS